MLFCSACMQRPRVSIRTSNRFFCLNLLKIHVMIRKQNPINYRPRLLIIAVNLHLNYLVQPVENLPGSYHSVQCIFVEKLVAVIRMLIRMKNIQNSRPAVGKTMLLKLPQKYWLCYLLFGQSLNDNRRISNTLRQSMYFNS